MSKAKKIHHEAVEMLLASITMTMGEDGARSSFSYGKPGAAHWEMSMGAEIYYHFVELNLAALFVRSNGPTYLKSLPLGDIVGKLQSFVSDNFWYLGGEVFSNFTERPFNEWVKDSTKQKLAELLSAGQLFDPKSELTLFPLSTVKVINAFKSDVFFMSSANAENPFSIEEERTRSFLDPTRFPPLKEQRGISERPSSWLGVYCPDPKYALKLRSSIMGSLALTALPHHRHMFSGRSVISGYCGVSERGLTHATGEAHTPPCMHDILVDKDDGPWLKLLSKKMVLADKLSQRHLKALEYFYRAWDKGPSERFPIMCMALDAIFGDANNATQAVIDGVRSTLGTQLEEQQLRALMNLRASVIHGGAPDVYDSRKYAKYYKSYRTDPIRDLEVVVSACIREIVFEGTLSEHEDPNRRIIKEAKAAGRIPQKWRQNSILNPVNSKEPY